MSTQHTTVDPKMTEPAAADATDTSRAGASLVGVGKKFVSKGRDVQAVDDINLDVNDGEYVVILGPSGCGKSTLIRCIAGLEQPTAGTVRLRGRTVYDAERSLSVKANDRNVGMVFQSYALWPHMTVAKNVEYPLKMRRVAKRERQERVAEILKAVECEALAQRLPAELSGGQQQRIALARALVSEPGILLLDEPLSNLDALLRVSLRTELLRLHRTLGYTALHITHDQEEALEMGDRVVLMREGRIEQMGPPEEVYARPVSPYAATFLGVRNRISLTVGGDGLEHPAGVVTGTSSLAEGYAKGDQLEMFVRNRDTHLSSASSASRPGRDDVELEGTLAQIVLGEGGRRQYLLDIGGSQWFAQHAESDLALGSSVKVSVPVASVLLYQGENLVYPQ